MPWTSGVTDYNDSWWDFSKPHSGGGYPGLPFIDSQGGYGWGQPHPPNMDWFDWWESLWRPFQNPIFWPGPMPPGAVPQPIEGAPAPPSVEQPTPEPPNPPGTPTFPVEVTAPAPTDPPPAGGGSSTPPVWVPWPPVDIIVRPDIGGQERRPPPPPPVEAPMPGGDPNPPGTITFRIDATARRDIGGSERPSGGPVFGQGTPTYPIDVWAPKLPPPVEPPMPEPELPIPTIPPPTIPELPPPPMPPPAAGGPPPDQSGGGLPGIPALGAALAVGSGAPLAGPPAPVVGDPLMKTSLFQNSQASRRPLTLGEIMAAYFQAQGR